MVSFVLTFKLTNMKRYHLRLFLNRYSIFRMAAIIFALLNFPRISQGQTKDVSIDYIYNTPTKVKAWMLGYQYGTDFHNPSLLSHNVVYAYNRTRFSMELNYSFPIKSMLGNDRQAIEDATNRIFTKTELVMAFGLWSKVKEEDIKVEWSAGYNKKWKVDVPVKALKIKGLQLGGNVYRSYLEINDIYYDVSSASAFIGYFWAKYSNFEFSVDGHYKKGLRFHKSYIDLFYSNGAIQEFVKVNTDLIPVGARIGTYVYSLRHLGMSFKMELGLLPHNFSKEGDPILFYGKMGIGVNLSARKLGEKYPEG